MKKLDVATVLEIDKLIDIRINELKCRVSRSVLKDFQSYIHRHMDAVNKEKMLESMERLAQSLEKIRQEQHSK